MHTVIENVDRPDRNLVEQFEGIPSAILSDVTTKFANTMDHGIKPVYDGASMAGTAITVDASPGDNLMIHKAMTLAQPGDVVVVDANGYTEAGIWGEIMSLSASALDLDGTVIDGAARDADGIEEIGYPVYSRAINPKGSYKTHPGSINTPVSCGNVSVAPGDIVVGDGDGVAVVRPENAADVLDRAHEKLDSEADLQERVRAGEYIFDLGGFDEAYDRLDIEEITE